MTANQMERKKVTIHITNVIRQMDAEEKSDMSVSVFFTAIKAIVICIMRKNN